MITSSLPTERCPTLSLNQRAQQALHSSFYRAAIAQTLPVALWRYPHQDTKHGLVDLSGHAQAAKIDFQQTGAGFAFAPFINAGGQATLFLKADLILAGQTVYPGRPQGGAKADQFLAHLQQLTQADPPAEADWSAVPVTNEAVHLSDRAEFCRLVEQAIYYIQSTDIKKVVASRATETPLPADFNPVAAFDKLCARYPHAFVSLVSIPGLGTWIGATPETLLILNPDRLETIALAGTQAYPADSDLEAVQWGAKEIEEQALVSDYISNFLRQLGLASFTQVGPRTVSAGNIIHLKTGFQVTRPDLAQTGRHRLTDLANQILDSLHPTSAVCGMPKKEALTFILEQEHYNRAFYSGFLGPVHINGQSQLFVNLRCMQLKPRRAILYVGAGITQDSQPQLEWQETVLKSNTLLSVLARDKAGEPD